MRGGRGQGGGGGGGSGGSQGGCEWRSKVFVKIQKKKNLRGGLGRGWAGGGVGGGGVPIRNWGWGRGGSKVWGR